ncbi:polysaccharide ABC transporter ATP-binding protein [Streptomyces cellostaticus]|uniref:Polysaccharide ABC transporter ATP-binding protein n=1 Tax=Streptomyces cellostaticus TaxID=67285 RepID=A0A101NTF7_9ACTN|nr:ABC transporter permease subunit [Streptomyces cellostaticus]KUM99026.1 polysaccharide ABC transporter ATP-binding protein [Streptomyces cellostaticus]GHI03511.1 polysaccharide ABC transporter ATP-binding protein [Streptomyces cellostaticus]
MSLTAGRRPDGTRPPAAVEEPTVAVATAGTKVRAPRRASKGGKVPFRIRLRRDRALILMTLPVIVLLLLFNYVPLLGNVVAFQDYDPYVSSNGVTAVFHSPWVGVEQFSRMLDDPLFWDAAKNTLVLFVLQLVFFFPIPIALALLINSVIRPRVRAVAQAIMYLPHFFSWVLVVTVFQQILGGAGIIAQTLENHGWSGFDLMTNSSLFKYLVIAEAVWKDAGWGIIVFLAALASVSTDLYEAAAMDGAGRWRRMWHVTLPALRPVVALLLVLRVGDALSVGFEQFLLQRDAVGAGASEVLDTYVWNMGIKSGDFSYAAAVGLAKGLIGICLVMGANKFAHLLGEQGVYKK